MAEERPEFSGRHRHQLNLDLLGIRLTRKAQSLGESRHVRVHHHALIHAKGVSEDDIGRFAADSVEAHKFIHRPGHPAVMCFRQNAAAGLDAPRLIPKEP
jgi:hypothetical protein